MRFLVTNWRITVSFAACFGWYKVLFLKPIQGTTFLLLFVIFYNNFVPNLSLFQGEITDRSVPLMCLGALALVTGFISLALPDTNNTTLPDTIAEAQTAYRKPYPKSQENTHV